MRDIKAEEQMVKEFSEKATNELVGLLEETGRIEPIIAYLVILDTIRALVTSLPFEDILDALEMILKHNKEFIDARK